MNIGLTSYSLNKFLVMAQTTDDIMVSVCMITYNHESFIREAIEGVLMQKTPFAFELVIGEDFSTDKTRTICEEYAIRFPDKIKLLPTKMNLGMMPNFIRTIEECRGKYIALCEGDDYWTDPLKLQKQVEFLEGNNQCSLCFTNAINISADGRQKDHMRDVFNYAIKKEYSIEDIIKFNFIPTASMLFGSIHLEDYYEHQIKLKGSPAGDWILSFFLSTKGKIGFIDSLSVVRRVHHGGVWSMKNEEMRLTSTIHIYKIMENISPLLYKNKIKRYIADTRYKKALFLFQKNRKIAAFQEFLCLMTNFSTPPSRYIYLMRKFFA